MKITSIKIYDVKVPFGTTAYVSSASDSISAIEGVVVCIATNDGLTGWGEMVPWGNTYLPEFCEGTKAALSVLCPNVLGKDPTNLNNLNSTMDLALYGHGYAKSAIDM